MSATSTTVSLVAVPLATPPTRQSMTGGYAKGSDESFTRWRTSNAIGVLNQAAQQLQQVIGLQTSSSSELSGLLALTNGNLSFGDFSGGEDSGNLKTVMIGGTSPATPNTAFTLTHNLGKVPNGFMAIQKNAAADFYGTAAGSGWTDTTMQIFCDTASVTYVILVLG